jgi:hypothetical protein
MKRKFSLPAIELPKFINSLRLDGDSNKAVRDPFAQDPDSRPPTPKSVRPPLPKDLNSELVAACTWIITHPKPSHERWESSSSVKPALDPSVIKQRYVQPRTEIPQRSKSARSMNSINTLLPGSKAGRRTGQVTALNDTTLGDHRVIADMKIAQSRADQLMQSGPGRTVATLHIPLRDSSHTHIRSVSAAPCPTLVTKAEPTERQKSMARSDSSCTSRTGRTGRTSGSSPHTDSAEYPRSASTGMTSITNTPARSKSASSQAINAGVDCGSVPDSDAINGELLRQEFDRHRRIAAAKDVEREAGENALCRATYIPSGDIYYADELALENMQPQQRKNRPRSRSIPRIHTADSTETDQQSQSGADQGRSRSRFRSRFRSESKSDIRSGQRSASRAGTVASEMRSRFDRIPDSSRQLASRASSVARSVKHYLRPRNSMASMAPQDDAGRDESFDDRATLSSPRSLEIPLGQPEERSRGRWAGLKRAASRSRSRLSSDDRKNSASVSKPESRGRTEALSSHPVKSAIDLNRELPPLPSLNQWTDTEDVAPEAFSPPEHLHLHPLRRGLLQIPPLVTDDISYSECTGNSRSAAPIRARKPVPVTATIYAPRQSIASGTVAQSARTTGRRQPSQTIATTTLSGLNVSHGEPLHLRRTQSRRDMHLSVENDKAHGHARTHSDLAGSPRKCTIDDFKRKMHASPKSDLDLSRQQYPSHIDAGGQQAHKSGWKSWANKLKPRATASYAESLNSSYHRRHESSDSSTAAAPVVHY